MYTTNECAIRFYDPLFNWLFETRRAESVQLTRELYGPGTFEIHIHPDKLDLSVLQPDNIITINQDGHKSGVIRDFTVTESRDKQEIIIYGDTGAGLTKNRIVVPPSEAQFPGAKGWDSVVNTNAETVIKHFAAMNLAAPYDANRRVLNLIITPDLKRGTIVSWRARYTQLSDELYNLCAFAEMGYEIAADPANDRWVLDVIPGTNRTVDQELVSPVTFRMEYQNVDGYTYSEDRQNYRNAAYIGGAGSDENRFVQIIGAENVGIKRREIFLDCGNIEAGNLDELLFYGNQKLGEYKEVKTVEAGAPPRVFTFERDFFLGDEVTVDVKRLGIRSNTRITVVKDVWERQSGHRAEVRFGGKLPNLFSVLNTQNRKEVR